MGKFCDVCAKGRLSGHNVSHSERKSNRTWAPNVQKVRVVVPMYLKGEPKGVKIGGGILAQVLRSVEVECLPTDIVEKFDVDVTDLDLEQTLFVRDLKLGDKFTTVTRGELAVAVIKAPDDDGSAKGGDKSAESDKKKK